MPSHDAENQKLASLLRQLLEAETGEDSMICHDGGFHYSGDFMSMEAPIIEPTSIVSPNDIQRLRERGLIVDTEDGDGARVTEAGRQFAYRHVD